MVTYYHHHIARVLGRDEFQRIDANLLLKLCEYFQCDIKDLLIIEK